MKKGSQNETTDQKKKKAIKDLQKSKEHLVNSAADMWKSLKSIVLYKNEELAEGLLSRIKDEIAKVEGKK